MWHFANLNKEQKLERRHLLDTYAAVAQISIFVPVLALQIYFLVAWVQRKKWGMSAEAEVPSSPYLKRARSAQAWWSLGGLRRIWRKGAWWAGERVEVWGFEALRGEMVVAGCWMGWLMLLCVVQTKGGMLSISFCLYPVAQVEECVCGIVLVV